MKQRILALALCLGLFLSACAHHPATGLDCAPEEARRLTLYTSHKEEVWWPIVKEFEERTGIWVDVVEGGTNELLSLIQDQQNAPVADVMFGGGVESLSSYSSLFAPYTCAGADSLDPLFIQPESLWTPFSSLPVVLIYNTRLIRPGGLTGWADLLRPELRGRIAFADPAVSGSSFTALMTMVLALGGDSDAILSAFADNLAGKQLSGSGEVVSAVANGEAWVGVTLEETALKAIAGRDDIALVYPAEGTSSVPDGSALIQGAPHEDNAKQFLDFIAGEDVQRLLTSQFCRRSVRSDLSPTDLPPVEELKLLDYDVTWVAEHHDATLMTWAFYLGEEEAAP